VGDSIQAERQYEAAVKASPNDVRIRRLSAEFKYRIGKQDEAQAMLRAILSQLRGSTDRSALAEVRRELAQMLIASGRFPQCVEAKSLIEENIGADRASASDIDLRSMAIVNASLPSKVNLDEAIKGLEMLDQHPGVRSLDDRFLLATLFLRANNWPKASQAFRKVAAESNDVRHAAVYVEALISRSELEEAEVWLRRVEQLAPAEYGTVDLRARLLARRNRYDDACKHLVEALSRSPTDPKVQAQWRRAATNRLEGFASELAAANRNDDAKRLFDQAYAVSRTQDGQSIQSLPDRVGSLIHRGRDQDAVAELERTWTQAQPAEAIALCVAMNAIRPTDPGLRDRLRRVLSEIGEKRSLPSAWLTLAAMQDRFHEYDAEEQSYRKVLTIDGNNVPALNNLAYLLALRKKDLPEAQAFANRAIAQAGPQGALRDTSALVRLASGQVAEAVADSNAAVRDEPAAQHFFHNAQIQFANGQRDTARESWQQARKLGLQISSLNPLEVDVYKELEAQLAP
jgi:tetratricopeptide (TPR) repeat protein